MSLSVALHDSLPGFTLDAVFEASGPVTALFGPSGSGKTSIVNIIAGLRRPGRGRVALGETVLLDTAAGIDVPRHRRRVGYVFQEGRLFPHLTVRQNLTYGRFFARHETGVIDLEAAVALLDIGHLLDRRPARLSGGEKQRVAIGRALLANPRLLLMDEPLAALDEARKAELLPFLERLRGGAGVPIVYVSHQMDEVIRLASHLVLVDQGRIAASGPLEDLMARTDLPLLSARRDAGAVLSLTVAGHDGNLTMLAGRLGSLIVPRLDAAPGSPHRLWIHARDVILAREAPAGISALNVVPALVAEVAIRADGGADVVLDCGGDRLIARITARSVTGLGLAPGVAVHAIVKGIALD